MTFENLSNPVTEKLPNQQKTKYDSLRHNFKKFFQSYAMAFNKE